MTDISSPWRIKEIQEEIEEALKEIHSEPNREYGLYVAPKFRRLIKQRFIEAVEILEMAYRYAHNIQKLVEGDNGDESFLKALGEDLNDGQTRKTGF
jgi:hypothetical protein